MRVAAASRASSTCSACTSIAAAVTPAVTAGVPSRSPPIQPPQRRNGAAADAPDGRDHRPAPSLGRVRREDGVDLERLDQTVESLRTEFGSKLADRRGQRLGHWFRSAVAFADDARTMVFLSEVGQMEIARERARHLLGAIESP